MKQALDLLVRVIKRRVTNGEKLTTVLKDYPKLSDSEKAEVKKIIKG